MPRPGIWGGVWKPSSRELCVIDKSLSPGEAAAGTGGPTFSGDPFGPAVGSHLHVAPWVVVVVNAALITVTLDFFGM